MRCILDVILVKSAVASTFVFQEEMKAVGTVLGGVISGNAYLSPALCRGKNMLLKHSAAVRLFLNKSDIISGKETEERK